MRVHDVHQSGYAKATEDQWDAMLADLAVYCSVAGLTESRGEPPSIEGWRYSGHNTESNVYWDERVWRLEDRGTVRLPTPRYKRGTAYRTDVPVAWVLLVHRETGLRYLRGVGHIPAHRQLLRQRRAQDAALKALGPAVKELVATHKPDETTLSFDFNLHLRRNRAHRAKVERAIEGTGLRLVLPPKPTRGRWTIDATLTTMRVTSTTMLHRYEGMDHRGFRAVLAPEADPVQPEPSVPEPAEAEEKEVDVAERIPFIEAPNSGGTYDKNLLVVHVTISPEVKGAARGVIAFWRRARTGSTQYVVDAHETIQAVREAAYAWAAGTHANRIGIHVELCGFLQSVRQWHDGYSTAELDRAARLFAELAVKHGIPIRKIGPAQIRKAYQTGRPEDGGICGHVDISHAWPADTSHTDPGRYFPWDEFLRLVRKYANDPTPAKDWFDMASEKDLQDAIRNTRITVKSGKDDVEKEWRLETLLSHLESEQDAVKTLLRRLLARDADALAEKVAARVNVEAVDPEMVKQAVKDALAEGTEG